jgi:hypothetical protein
MFFFCLLFLLGIPFFSPYLDGVYVGMYEYTIKRKSVYIYNQIRYNYSDN